MHRLSLLLLLLAGTASAQQPRVLVETSPEVVSVGEPLRLRVTVLGPTWFPRAPAWPSFEIANAIVRLPPDSSRSTSQRIDGETWAGVVRNYEVYPLVAASFRLEGLQIRVTYASPEDRSPITTEVAVPTIEFRAVVPAGAESIRPYVAGTRFTLTRETDLGERELAAGDAVVVTYAAELDGLPAMFIPPLYRDRPVDGVVAYPATPVIEDGDVARRIETVTFVFEAGGQFELPGVEVDWWNLARGVPDSAIIPPLSVAVSGPAFEPPEEAENEALGGRIFTVLAALLVVVFLFRLLSPQVSRRREAAEEKRRAWRASEQWAFAEVESAIRSGDARQTYHAALRWSGRTDPGLDVRDFAARYGDARLVGDVDSLSRGLYANDAPDVDLRNLGRGMAAARGRWLAASGRQGQETLEPLNP